MKLYLISQKTDETLLDGKFKSFVVTAMSPYNALKYHPNGTSQWNEEERKWEDENPNAFPDLDWVDDLSELEFECIGKALPDVNRKCPPDFMPMSSAPHE